jgi:hypothetical protein
MKTRNGFVSNSSTSSFIAVGFSLKEKPKNIPSKYEDCIYRDYNGKYYFIKEIFGFEYAESTSLDKFNEKYEKAKKIAEEAIVELNPGTKLQFYGSTTDSSGEGGMSPYDPEYDDDYEEEEDEDT